MQRALQSGTSTVADPAPTRSRSRKKKFAAASVAFLGASAIAVTPVATGPELMAAQSRSYQLTASYTPNPLVTDSPDKVITGVLGITGNNLSGLANSIMANPFPLLTQIGANQQGYLNRITDAFEAIQTSSEGFFDEGVVKKDADGNDLPRTDPTTGLIIRANFSKVPGNGYLHGQNALAYLKAGNIFKAYEEFNAMALYSNTVAASKVGGLLMDTTVVTSWYKDKSGNLTTSAVRYELPDGSVKLPDGTPVTKDTPGAKEVKNAVALREDGVTAYTTTSTVRGIPGQMVENASNLFSSLMNKNNIQSGLFYSSWAAFGGVPYEVARSVDAMVTAIKEQDFQKAFNVLVNAPIMTVNALINGFDYLPDDIVKNRDGTIPKDANGNPIPIASWPGLFAPVGINGATGSPQHPGGLIYQAIFGIPSAGAGAIDNDPAKPASLFSGLNLGGLNLGSLGSGLNLGSLGSGLNLGRAGSSFDLSNILSGFGLDKILGSLSGITGTQQAKVALAAAPVAELPAAAPVVETPEVKEKVETPELVSNLTVQRGALVSGNGADAVDSNAEDNKGAVVTELKKEAEVKKDTTVAEVKKDDTTVAEVKKDDTAVAEVKKDDTAVAEVKKEDAAKELAPKRGKLSLPGLKGKKGQAPSSNGANDTNGVTGANESNGTTGVSGTNGTTGANDDNKGAAHETKDSSNDSKPAASQDNGKKDNASNGKKDSPRKARQNTKRNKGGSN